MKTVIPTFIKGYKVGNEIFNNAGDAIAAAQGMAIGAWLEENYPNISYSKSYQLITSLTFFNPKELEDIVALMKQCEEITEK